jgi:beta-galactosidase
MTKMIVGYDLRAITLNGKRTLLLSGAIQYPHSTPAMWPKLMQQSREAGLNTIETYVFWNLHEARRGVFDFSERLNLFRFCQLAQEHGLYVILRVGPYICAETNYGGFPAWLRDVPGMQMRTLNQPFMDEMERWVTQVTGYLHALFASNGGPIILLQLENEYNLIAAQYGAEGQQYLQWASDLAHRLDLGIPSIMCVGATSGSLETINGFYGHAQIQAHRERNPNQPAIWTEDWSGWYDTYSHAHHIRTTEDCAYAVARFIAAGGTGVNYYMWHGGTNFERSTMYLQTTSYDFNAPLNEYGLPTTKSQHLAQLNALLHTYADLLIAQEHIEEQVLGEHLRAYIYAQDQSELIFLCNDALQDTHIPFAGLHFALPARSVSLISHGQLLLNTATINTEQVIHYQRTLHPDLITDWNWYSEPLPTEWPLALQTDRRVASAPIEQLLLTHDRTDYCWYTTSLSLTAEQAGAGLLKLVGVADLAHIFVDGQLQATTQGYLAEDRGPLDGPGFIQSFPLTLTEGTHTLSILTCALGLIKGDWMIGGQNMVEESKGLWGQVCWNEELLSGDWTMQPGLVGERGNLFADGGALVSWQTDWQAAVGRPLSWWRFAFSRPETEAPLAIDLTGMNKGLAWLNGRCIGRYWLIAGTQEGLPEWQQQALRVENVGAPSQQYYHLPAEWLQEQNVLVLFEELGGDPSRPGISSIASVERE